MNDPAFRRAARADDAAGFAAVAAVVRDWEPRLELYRPPREALLYEPDGTLYAFALSEASEWRADRRALTVDRGDAVVVPQAYAVDAGPVVDLVALRYDGPAPDHFRERFIQVWGVEHLPAPPYVSGARGSHPVIPVSDVRHRVPYVIHDVNPANSAEISSSDDVLVVFGLIGAVTLTVDAPGGRVTCALGPDDLLPIAPGGRCTLGGEGRVGVVTVLNELTHGARRAGQAGAAGRSPSPEYQPPGGG